ncbi:MAG: PD-(D/E)XK nuclease family protein [Bacteroidetes bacterium]|nr:PD-(D/E)XK nuclease family protein [Bacteroidota bacterium]
MQKVKSIYELYSEVKNYDLALTVDASLADGLNRLVDTPCLGIFASTPRRLAQKFSIVNFPKIYSKFEFVNAVSKETGKNFRLIHALTENILSVWNQSGLLELTEIHLSDEAKELLPYFEKFPMIELAMQSFDENFFNEKNIAVIGREFFNELDLQVLPKKPFNEINIFKGEDFSPGKTYIFSSTKALIDNTTRLITRENMNHAAIVLEPSSGYNVLLQTRLKEEGIDVLVKTSLADTLTVRFMLNLIENSFGLDLLQAKDFKEAGKFFRFEVDTKSDDYNFESVVNSSKDKKLKLLFKLMNDAGKFSFKELTNELIEKFDCPELHHFILLLSKINFTDEKISEENLIQLKYILENFDLELPSKKKGVLFVDAKNSAFINREIIFYLGLDESWSVSANEKIYIDKAKEDKINFGKFTTLLQQGSERLYFAQQVKDNAQVIPAPYFSIAESRTVSLFTDKIFNPVFIHDDAFVEENKKYTGENENEQEEITSIAPTPLKRFMLCPARYFYDTLMPQRDAPHFLKGNLIHQFAEFYFHHPEFCKSNARKILDFILEKYSRVITKSETEIERTNFKIALNNVCDFLDKNPVEKIALEHDVKTDNELMENFRQKKIFDFTEKDLSKDFILKGRADLRGKNILVDYKSGSIRYTKRDLPALINIDYIIEAEDADFDFQAVSYLAALKNENPSEKELKFIYNYVLANRKNIVDERLKTEDNLTEFTYIDLDFIQYLQTENCYYYARENSTKDAKKYFEALSFQEYKEIFDDIDLSKINFFDKDSTAANLCRELHAALARAGFDYKSFRKKEERTYLDELKKACEVFYKIRSNEGLIFKDDVKKFIDFVKQKLTELNSYRKNNFPAMPIFESNQICKECDYLNICRGNLLWN